MLMYSNNPDMAQISMIVDMSEKYDDEAEVEEDDTDDGEDDEDEAQQSRSNQKYIIYIQL